MKLTKLLTKTLTRIGLAAVLLPTLNLQLSTARAQGTAFTYQGVLQDGGAPATGLYDLEFRAFDAGSGGAQQGGAVTANDVPVTNGLFTATLDFGAAVFTGPARWLNIAVRPGASAGAYADLLPRQPILASPYAVFAGGSAAAGVTGTLADAQLSANVALRAGGNAFTGNQSVMSGNVGIGTTTVPYTLTVAGNYIGLASSSFADLTMSGNSGAGLADIAVVSTANQFSSSASPNDMVIRSQTGKLLLQSGVNSAGITIDTANRVGIGTTTPNAPLSFGNSLGNTKLALWEDGLGGAIGLGIQGNQFRLHVNNASDRFSFLNGPAGTEVMSVRGNGTVGIGTTSPFSTLDVYGSGSAGGFAAPARALKVRSTASFGAALGVDASTVAGGKEWDFFSTGGNAGEGQGRLIFRNDTDNLNAMTITPSGNVGIGTTSPGQKLDIVVPSGYGGARISSLDPNGGADIFLMNDNPSVLAQIGVNGSATAGVIPNALFITQNGNHPIKFATSSTDRMIVTGNGNVGIGTTTPGAKLTVIGSSQTGNFNASYLAFGGGSFGVVGHGPHPMSIYADGDVMGLGFYALSDERIKSIRGQSDRAADLRTLRDIQITDYRFKDEIGKGNGQQKKVIAQQVEKVFPQAVSQHTGVVPDIFKNAAMQDGWVQLATDLKTGERVKLIGEKEEGIHEVLEVKAGAFRTAFKPATEKVFVYGREVKDVRNVDYEAISMLNVSATQELARKLDKQESELTDLRAELSKLRSEKSSLAQTVNDMQARFVRLEQAMNKTTVPVVKDVSASADVK